MVIVQGNMVVEPPAGLGPREAEVFAAMVALPESLRYSSMGELRFELAVRSRLIEAAEALNGSGVRFAVYKDSACNEKLWRRTPLGGFELLPDTEPAEGIRDIFRQGKKYAFECATAMVIVLYKGFLDVLGDVVFNAWFGGILLYDWHYDEDLRLVDTKQPKGALPGDVQYFKNPDVAANLPMWQGENVLRLGADRFYGHGVGIKGEEAIIESLNRKRRDGALRSAYMADIVVRPDYPALFRALLGTGNWAGPPGEVGPSAPLQTAPQSVPQQPPASLPPPPLSPGVLPPPPPQQPPAAAGSGGSSTRELTGGIASSAIGRAAPEASRGIPYAGGGSGWGLRHSFVRFGG